MSAADAVTPFEDAMARIEDYLTAVDGEPPNDDECSALILVIGTGRDEIRAAVLDAFMAAGGIPAMLDALTRHGVLTEQVTNLSDGTKWARLSEPKWREVAP